MPRTAEDERTDLRYIRTPELWPNWPFLPLKRGSNQTREIAYLLAEPRDKGYHLYDGNMLAAKQSDPILKTYDSPEALVVDGWVVD